MPTDLDALLSSIRECETHDAVKSRLASELYKNRS